MRLSPAIRAFRKERRFRLQLMRHLRQRGKRDLLKRAQAAAARFRATGPRA